jgi:hypothetical protein
MADHRDANHRHRKMQTAARRLLGYINVGVCFLKFMHRKQAAIQIRHIPNQLREISPARTLVLPQSFMKQAAQEQTIEGMKVAFAGLLTYKLHTVGQIILVAVEEAFLLDEVNKHQAVEHQRGVPSLVG